MKEKWNVLLPVLLMVAFAITRWPGMMPTNFSAAYALAFCAGVYFPKKLAWWLPLVTLAVTDIILNVYYYMAMGINAFQYYQLVNYVVFGGLIWMGQKFSARASWFKLVGGGILGAIIFYIVTNTSAWLFNPFNHPEYTKTLTGWITALTKGTAGYPQTWEFFRNTLMSGGLFTALFVAAMKLNEAPEPKEKEADAPEGDESESPEHSESDEAKAQPPA